MRQRTDLQRRRRDVGSSPRSARPLDACDTERHPRQGGVCLAREHERGRAPAPAPGASRGPADDQHHEHDHDDEHVDQHHARVDDHDDAPSAVDDDHHDRQHVDDNDRTAGLRSPGSINRAVLSDFLLLSLE